VAPDGASLPVVGAAGGEVLTLRAGAAGTTTLLIEYGQPWEGGTKGTWTYQLSVTVE
jgi:predicted secreted protein